MIPLLRALEHVHGHLGWLTVAALLHPAILLRNPARRARLSVALATGFALATGALGCAIYPSYRAAIKPGLFASAPRLGWLFERKEHLAVGAVAFAVAGCVAHLSLPRRRADADAGDGAVDPRTLRTTAVLAHRAYVVSFVFAALVATFGVVVASYATF